MKEKGVNERMSADSGLWKKKTIAPIPNNLKTRAKGDYCFLKNFKTPLSVILGYVIVFSIYCTTLYIYLYTCIHFVWVWLKQRNIFFPPHVWRELTVIESEKHSVQMKITLRNLSVLLYLLVYILQNKRETTSID